jgi:hypothetical protein
MPQFRKKATTQVDPKAVHWGLVDEVALGQVFLPFF